MENLSVAGMRNMVDLSRILSGREAFAQSGKGKEPFAGGEGKRRELTARRRF
jgi:hypothetical protein